MRIVLDALRDGPKDTAAVAAIAVAAGIPKYRARRRIWLTLDRLHKRGLVVPASGAVVGAHAIAHNLY